MSFGTKVMVVGAGWDQIPIIRAAKERGYFVLALDGDRAAPGLKWADKAYIISTRDKNAVLKIARQESVTALTYMITESPLPAIRHVADALGVPAPSHKSVAATVSKIRMRELFMEAGIENSRYGKAPNVGEALAIGRKIGCPLVMKPADVGGQLGLFRVTDLREIPELFDVSVSNSVSGEVILEEWLEGEEYNVVAIVHSGQIHAMTVSNRYRHKSMAFGIVNRHLFPSDLSASQIDDIRRLCQRSVEALEIVDGIIFPQLIMTTDGPRTVETGERIPGGVMKELFELATGYDLVQLQLDISLGKKLTMSDYKTGRVHPAVTVKFLNSTPGPLRPGSVATVVGREQVLALDGIVDAQFYNNPSSPQEIRPLRNARDRFFYIIAVGNTRSQVVKRSDTAARIIDFIDEQNTSLKLVDGHAAQY